MGLTLLVGGTNSNWNPWLQEELDGRDRLCLDPADTSHGPPGRLALIRGETVVAWRFYGGLSPRRSPHILVRAAATLLPEIREEGVVQLFPVTASPLIQQLARCIIELARPTQILMASGTPLPLSPWPAPVEEVECEPALPGAVAASKRRARWRQWFSECEVHSISMFQVTLEGVRLGSGRALNAVELEQAGLSRALRAEIQGGKLWIVGDETFDAETIARALDYSGCDRAQSVSPSAYHDVVCSFARSDGEDFALGVIREANFHTGAFRILSPAVSPAVVDLLRIGGLRIGDEAQELGEAPSWSL